MKVLVVAPLALVVLLQALCAHAGSIGNAPDDVNNALDLSDKDVLALVAGLQVDDGDQLATQKLQLSKQSLDIGVGILKAIQNILNGVNERIQNAYNAVLGAVNTAIENAQKATQDAIDSWTNNLQNVIDAAGAYNSTLVECQASQPTLQSVGDALNADVQGCVTNATADVQTALEQLEAIRPQTEKVVQDARQAITDCQPQGWLAGACVAGKAPGLFLEATGLAANATIIGAQVTGQLVIAVPLQSAACVGAAVTSRGAEAAAITDAIRRCVEQGLSNSTFVNATSWADDSTTA